MSYNEETGAIERCYTAAEASRFLRVRRNWIYRLVGKGKLKPFIKDAQKLFFHSELMRYKAEVQGTTAKS